MNCRHGWRDSRGTTHGRVTTVAALAGALLTLGASGPTASANPTKIAPAVITELSDRAADAQVPVLIVLDDQATPRPETDAPKMIGRLRATATATQAPVLADLSGPARRFWLVNAIATRISAAELSALAVNPEVRSVQLDLPAAAAVSADSTGAVSPLSDWGVDAINAPAAWSTYAMTGRGVRIGSIDTGVDTSNPRLADRVVAWRDFVAGQAAPYDDNGHGTHTIGVMVARNDDTVTTGIAPDAQVVVAKAMGRDGTSSTSTLLAAAQWITDPDGDPATADQPTIINNSWTASGAQNEWFRPMVQAWVAMGITPVFAAGNGGGDVGSPSSYPEVITVGATDQGASVWSGSNRGTSTWSLGGTSTSVGKPDVVAPGVSIVSTVPGGYADYTGTSMAAPHVAATIALLKQARPDLTTEEIRSILRRTATDVGDPGPDLPSGAGRIDALAAVAATGAPAQAPSPAPQMTPVQAPENDDAQATLADVQVVRNGARFDVTGRVTRPTRISVQAEVSGSGGAFKRRAATTSSSRFRLTVPVRDTGGAYRLTMTADARGHRPESILLVPEGNRRRMIREIEFRRINDRMRVRGQLMARSQVTACSGTDHVHTHARTFAVNLDAPTNASFRVVLSPLSPA